MAGGWLSPTFVIGQIKIGTIEGSSCFNLGNNLPSGFTSRKVHNQGFGSVEGDNNRLSGLRSFLHETPGTEPDEEAAMPYEPPEWIREWMKESFADAAAGFGEEAEAESTEVEAESPPNAASKSAESNAAPEAEEPGDTPSSEAPR
ncbi:hypothetical protein [Gorillibacterium sp. sgz500922]|uniref:hypothetical protein n=1 Tax=Gorillibacterium sp. sgz500922 TaxID=3446694 RepID=UPI003F661A8A